MPAQFAPTIFCTTRQFRRFLNGNYLDIATTGEREMGITADLYYTPKENVITLEETPASSSVLTVNYRAFVNGRTVVYNSEEIARINANTDRKGVIARYENRNDAITTEELTKVGKSYLKYKGKSEITLTIQTKGTDLFNVGQRVTYNAPLEELSQEYMVKSKKTTMYIVANEVFYEYTLSSSFNSEDAINYFDIMYILIASIYMMAAIFILKSEFNKKQGE